MEQIDRDRKNGTRQEPSPFSPDKDRHKNTPSLSSPDPDNTEDLQLFCTRSRQRRRSPSYLHQTKTIRGHRHIEGKFHLIVKWQGIEDADAIAYKPPDIKPTLPYKTSAPAAPAAPDPPIAASDTPAPKAATGKKQPSRKPDVRPGTHYYYTLAPQASGTPVVAN